MKVGNRHLFSYLWVFHQNSFLYSPWLRPYCDFMILDNPPVDLHLIFEKSSLKNKVGQTRFLVYFKLDFYCKIQVQNRPKMEFIEIHFSKYSFQKSSADQQGEFGDPNWSKSKNLLHKKSPPHKNTTD